MAIWELLHNLTHINHNFKKVSNTFVLPSTFSDLWKWNTNSYQQSIQMFALLVSIVGIIYFVIFLTLTFCYGCCGLCNKCRNCNKKKGEISFDEENQTGLIQANAISRNRVSSIDENSPGASEISKNDKRVLKPCALYTRLFLAIIVILLIGGTLYDGYDLSNTINDIENNWDDSYQPYQSCISDGDSLKDTLQQTINECQVILQTKLPSDINATIVEVQKQLQDSYNVVDDNIATAKTISWGSNNTIKSYHNVALYVGVGLISFTALLLLLSLCTNSMKTTKCIYFNHILSILLALGMIMLWIVASYEFAFSVEVSDVCAAPNQAILQAANRTSNFDNETWEIAEYYLYCDTNHPNNPLITQTTNAYQNLISIQSSIIYLNHTAANYSIQEQVAVLYSDYQTCLTELVELNQSLNCSTIHNVYYVSIQNDTCHKLIQEWFILYVLQFMIVTLLIVRSCFMCIQNNDSVVHSEKTSIPSHYNENINKYEGSINQNFQYGMLVDDVALNDTSYGRTSSVSSQSSFTDDDVQECVRYLTQFENENERKKQAEILKQKGYPNKKHPKPLNSDLVYKSMAIVRNRQNTMDSKYKHPLYK